MSQSSYNYIGNKNVRAAMLIKREYTRSFFSGTLDVAREPAPLIVRVWTVETEPLPQYENCLARTAEGVLALEPLGKVTTRLTRRTYVVDLLA